MPETCDIQHYDDCNGGTLTCQEVRGHKGRHNCGGQTWTDKEITTSRFNHCESRHCDETHTRIIACLLLNGHKGDHNAGEGITWGPKEYLQTICGPPPKPVDAPVAEELPPVRRSIGGIMFTIGGSGKKTQTGQGNWLSDLQKVIGPPPEGLTPMPPAPDLPEGGMRDSRIWRPLTQLLKDQESLVADYNTSDRKAFRRHIISVLEDTFGLLATLYGYDPWRHYLTEPSSFLSGVGLDELLQAIWHLQLHQQEWETPRVKNKRDSGPIGGPSLNHIADSMANRLTGFARLRPVGAGR